MFSVKKCHWLALVTIVHNSILTFILLNKENQKSGERNNVKMIKL